MNYSWVIKSWGGKKKGSQTINIKDEKSSVTYLPNSLLLNSYIVGFIYYIYIEQIKFWIVL